MFNPGVADRRELRVFDVSRQILVRSLRPLGLAQFAGDFGARPDADFRATG